jgi:septin family protein
MLSNNLTSSSIESDGGEVASSNNIVEYGPIQICVCRKPIPTIATGRRSKHLVLVGDEAMRREKRREKNREAARKLKEKRQLIEEELDQKVKELENEHSDLQNYLQQLREKKQILEQEITNLLIDPLDELLSNKNQEMLLLFEQHADDLDLLDESVEKILNCEI